jgi:hypothetical protein
MVMTVDKKPSTPSTGPRAASPREEDSYVVPLVHTRLPARAVEIGFWGGLAGAAVLGAIDLPLAIALGAGVLIARHRHR